MGGCLFVGQKYKFRNSSSVRNVTELDILHINKIREMFIFASQFNTIQLQPKNYLSL